MAERLSSVSVVLAADAALPDIDFIRRLEEVLDVSFVDVEIILVADSARVSPLDLKDFVEKVPDTTCLVLSDWSDEDAAHLAGMENAIGDYVVLIAPGAPALAALPQALAEARRGVDVVFATPAVRRRPRPLERLAYGALSLMTGKRLVSDPLELAVMSREAALHLLSKLDAEVLIKAREAGPGFAVAQVPLGGGTRAGDGPSGSFGYRAGKAVRLTTSLGAMPMRILGLVSVATGILSLLYAAYVVLIYLFKPDVLPGWTTLSLQVAGLMFLFSLMFWLLSEYVVEIHGAVVARRRRNVVRELRSNRTRRAGRLNVVDADGNYHLGAPDLAHVPPPRG